MEIIILIIAYILYLYVKDIIKKKLREEKARRLKFIREEEFVKRQKEIERQNEIRRQNEIKRQNKIKAEEQIIQERWKQKQLEQDELNRRWALIEQRELEERKKLEEQEMDRMIRKKNFDIKYNTRCVGLCSECRRETCIEYEWKNKINK